MLYGFVGRTTASTQLKQALDMGVQRTRVIADRVSKASLANTDGFALPGVPSEPGSLETGQVDMEAEMVSLADEQIRFEANSKLLQKSYEQLRSALKTR